MHRYLHDQVGCLACSGRRDRIMNAGEGQEGVRGAHTFLTDHAPQDHTLFFHSLCLGALLLFTFFLPACHRTFLFVCTW